MYDELVDRLRKKAKGFPKTGEVNPILLAAADAIEELSKIVDESIPKDDAEIIIAEVAKPRWIPVTERLPEDRKSVLVHRDDGGIFIFEYFTTSPTDECWIDDHLNVYSAYCVTHWMPLPEPPKEDAT